MRFSGEQGTDQEGQVSEKENPQGLGSCSWGVMKRKLKDPNLESLINEAALTGIWKLGE